MDSHLSDWLFSIKKKIFKNGGYFMISLESVSKSFKEIELFKDITTDFPLDKKILIKGVNGSGKSVLLKMLVGYSQPTNGKIKVEDYQIGKDGDFIPNAGVSINAPEFMRNLTGIENLLYLAEIRKVASKEDIYNLAKKLDLDEALEKKYKTYSLGMKQKMRIIQVLMDQPNYLILDEPFDALDKKSKEVVKQLLNNYVHEKEGRVLIFTSHNEEIEEFADLVYEINDYQLELLSQE